MSEFTTITLDGHPAPPAAVKPGRRERTGSPGGGARRLRIAYLTSRFPKITETFILYEMRAVESLGIDIELYPLWREPARVMHEEARSYVQRAHFVRLASGRTVAANLMALVRRPRAYLGALASGLRANWGSIRYLLGFLAAFPKAVLFARDMQQRRVEHVHAHFASHPAAVAWIVRRLTGIPYSFTAHGSDLHRDQHMLTEKVAESELVVAISEYNRQRIVEHCGNEYQDRVQVIHCGTDTDIFRPDSDAQQEADRLQQAAPSAVLQIGCIGTLHEVKGQVHLIRACRLLRDRDVPFQLHLIGDGPDESALRAEVAGSGLDAVVLFRGRCTRQQLSDMLPKMDVVVAPSVPTPDGRREGIPVALMEAMSAGVAVVASSMSGIPELVQHRRNGLLVSPGDVSAIAAALQELASAPELRDRLADAGRETVELEFDQHRCAERLVAEIRRLHDTAPSQKNSASKPVLREVWS